MLQHGERVVDLLIDRRGSDDSDYSAHANSEATRPASTVTLELIADDGAQAAAPHFHRKA